MGGNLEEVQLKGPYYGTEGVDLELMVSVFPFSQK